MSASALQPIGQTLGACADELESLAYRCHWLQVELAPALQSAEVIEEAQTLDLLTQTLDALARYLGAVAQATPGEWRLDPCAAAALIPLTELARRLTGGAFPPEHKSGELDFFGAD